MIVYNFMFAGLPGKPSGLAKSVLNRTKGFFENGIASVILAPAFNKFHVRDMQLLKEKGLLKVPVRYMFEDLSESTYEKLILSDPVANLVRKKNLDLIPDENPLIKRLFKNGKYEYFVKYYPRGGGRLYQAF